MPVPSSINDLSTTAGSNSPGGSETPGDGDNYLRSHASFIATLRDKLNGNADTGTVKNATFSGTMAGAASWAGVQTFAAGLKAGNSAVSDASTLDWYQEGTFTPVIEGDNAAGTGAYTTQTGRWSRIGRLVFVEIRLDWTSHTGSGFVRVKTLPFAAAAVNNLRAVVVDLATNTLQWSATSVAGQTYLTVAGVSTAGANTDLSVPTGGGTLNIQGFYEA